MVKKLAQRIEERHLARVALLRLAYEQHPQEHSAVLDIAMMRRNWRQRRINWLLVKQPHYDHYHSG
jgi:hypothetical protein